jgi:uncharacterized protein YkwD
MRWISKCFTLPVALLCLSTLAISGAWGQRLEEFNRDYLESPAGGPDLSEAVQMVIDKTNELRREEGLEPVEPNQELTETAAYFAAFMARTGEYGHTADGNQPSERASLFDYEYCIVSENIGMQLRTTGFSTRELGRSLYEGWLESPDHREAMVNPHVTETGVAVAHDPESGEYYGVQMFGRPRSAAFRFKVINRTQEELTYTLAPQGEENAEGQQFEIPGQTIRAHMQCRPVVITWGWTESAEPQEAQEGIAFVVTGSGTNLQVRQQPIENSP